MNLESRSANVRVSGRALTRFKILCVAAALGASAVGCAADVTAGEDLPDSDEPAEGVVVENEEALHLIARVDLDAGGSVRFYEPEPGRLIKLESGRSDAMRVRGEGEDQMRPDELYESLSGKQAPRALVEAVERVAASAARVDASKTALPDELDAEPARDDAARDERADGVSVSSQALGLSSSRSAFQSAWCTDTSGTDLNWTGITGSSSVGEKYDKNWVRSAARPYRGTIHYVFKTRPWYSWRDEAVVNIPVGWYEAIEEWNNIDFDIKGWVNEADGDGYDFCTHYGTGTIWVPAE